MKKILLSLAISFVMQVGAQSIDTTLNIDTLLFIHHKNGLKDSSLLSNIDSLTFKYDSIFNYDTIWTGYGNVLLPGNATCDTHFISVSGCAGVTTITYNGYTYNLVEIGNQCWFKENLRTTKYKDGTLINCPGNDNTAWQSSNYTGAYAWYNNDSATYASTYGALYNWYAVDNSAGLCPTGWHVPTDCEWMYLENTLGMSIADQQSLATAGISTGRGTTEGDKLKETGTSHWLYDPGSTDSTGFTGLPAGKRGANALYSFINGYGYWWTSSDNGLSNINSNTMAYARDLYYMSNRIGRTYWNKWSGYSVRCIKD